MVGEYSKSNRWCCIVVESGVTVQAEVTRLIVVEIHFICLRIER